jgi:hypothetical protein
MLGKVGTVLGAAGVNIVSAAVGYRDEADAGDSAVTAVMVVTTSTPVPQQVLDDILAGPDFLAARAVSL